MNLLKVINSSILVLSCLACLTACGAGNIEWKEEVQLNDGKIIIVERDAIYQSGGDEWASNRSGSKINEYRIRFEYPIGSRQMVEWRSTKKSPQTYPEVPLVLDVPAGKPTIFSSVSVSPTCDVYSKYVYQKSKWKEEILPREFEQHTTNLLFGSKRHLPLLLNLREKYKRNNGLAIEKLLSTWDQIARFAVIKAS